MPEAVGEIFWKIPVVQEYAPGLELPCTLYVANPNSEAKRYGLRSQLVRNGVILGGGALFVHGSEWFEVDSGEFIRIPGTLRLAQTSLDLVIALIDHETGEWADSVATRLVQPSTSVPAQLVPALTGWQTADFYIEGKTRKAILEDILSGLGDVEGALSAHVTYQGTTTAAGDTTGKSLIDSSLIGMDMGTFEGMTLVVYPNSPSQVDSFDVPAGGFDNATGEITLSHNYKGGQIPAGTPYAIVTTRAPITELHGVFVVLPSSPDTAAPDTDQDLSLSVSTVEGIPPAAALTAGTITITRVRGGVETVIVNAAACSVASGRIYYDYTFPSADWQGGDEYKAVFSGQAVDVATSTYNLSDVRCKGRVVAGVLGEVPIWGTPRTGTLTTTGGEDTVFEVIESDPYRLWGYIFLDNMQAGDTFRFRVKVKDNSGDYRLKDEQELTGAQVIEVFEIENIYGDGGADIKVTIERLAGADRDFQWRYNLKKEGS